MLSTRDILETIDMIRDENLDVRTVTMGISLLDCADPDPAALRSRVYDKITRCAGRLVPVCVEIEREFGIPIVNKRISVTPCSMLLASCGGRGAAELAQTLERAARECGVNFIGGFSALVHKGFSAGDRELISAIPEALAETERVCSSVNVGSTKAGINMDAVALMGGTVLESAKLTAGKNCIGAAKLVVFCNAPEDNPFMAGAFHGPGEPDCVINVGVSGPGVVRSTLERSEGLDLSGAAELIKRTAFKITRMGQLVGREASDRLGVPFGIVDLSLAPTPAVGDSVARILEQLGLESTGGPGTTAALAMLNDAVKKGGVMASSHVGGLSGAFIPVSEDEGMIAAASKGDLRLEKLEAMTSVCSVGLDMIIIPGDTSAATISAIIADEAAIGMVNSKTTAVRLIPAIGKKEGETLDFGGLLGGGPVMPVSRIKPDVFIARGGRIPAPIQSLKN
ncbi:MAG: PFL family protein [Clostridia bacterium]|nr:PFL family protein [Clostridia bacterium]